MKQIFSFILGCIGLYWVVVGAGATIMALRPLAPGTRSDFEHWLVALLGAGTFILGLACLGGAVLFYLSSQEERPVE